MNKFFLPLAPVFILAAAALLGAATVHAQTVITSLPYVITTKGLYVLNSDLASSQTSGNLIEIKASNVTLDFQGHFISGPAGNTSQTTFGVYAYEESNLTVKNGTVAYCNVGVFLRGNAAANTNAVGATVDNLRVTYCYYTGILMQYCVASTITNCKVSQIGYSGINNTYAISAVGGGTSVQNNTVSNVMGFTPTGIDADRCFVRQNTIYNAKYGIYGGKYQDNLTLGCTTPYSAGIDAGGNN